MPEHDLEEARAVREVHHLAPLVAEEGAQVEGEVVFVGKRRAQRQAQSVVLRSSQEVRAHARTNAEGIYTHK